MSGWMNMWTVSSQETLVVVTNKDVHNIVDVVSLFTWCTQNSNAYNADDDEQMHRMFWIWIEMTILLYYLQSENLTRPSIKCYLNCIDSFFRISEFDQFWKYECFMSDVDDLIRYYFYIPELIIFYCKMNDLLDQEFSVLANTNISIIDIQNVFESGYECNSYEMKTNVTFRSRRHTYKTQSNMSSLCT